MSIGSTVGVRSGGALGLIGSLLLFGAGHFTTQGAAPRCLDKIATIIGTDKADSLRGTSKNDVIVGMGGGDTIDGAGGNDLICGGDGVGGIASDDDDTIGGGPGNDTLQGEGGDDRFDGGPGDATMAGGPNRVFGHGDTATFAAGAAVVVNRAKGKATGQGKDSLSEIENLVGSPGNDVLSGDPASLARTLFMPLGGNDRVDGAGRDIIDFSRSPHAIVANLAKGKASGEGNDKFKGIYWLTGSALADHLTGDNGSQNFLYGGAGDDVLDGGGGVDALSGDEGNDRLIGGSGDDNPMDGGPGDDVLLGGPGNDYLAGERPHFVVGTLGEVDKWISPGKDVLHGGGGDDTLFRDPKNDLLDGGTGRDTVAVNIFKFDKVGANVKVDLITQTVAMIGESDRLQSVENASVTTRGFIDLRGDERDNVLDVSPDTGAVVDGGRGNDSLRVVMSGTPKAGVRMLGGDGKDEIEGGNGNDTLIGGSGNDSMLGAGGNDKLYGEDGDDVLDGGFNADLSPDHDKLDGGPGDDTCTEFDDEVAVECEVLGAP